jgi:monofunctional biosynthetic peptidoglycan transglycosylase
LLRFLSRLVLAFLALILIGVVAYRFVPPPGTPLMLIRALEGEGRRQSWQPIGEMSPHLLRAVIASEDARFCGHHGFDWIEIGNALEALKSEHRLRGASTISQQTAKNLFLWPGGGLPRKAVEAYATILLELFWSKTRILETYLNIVEWGPGLYGAEAAARTYFHIPARNLSERQAALLAAILPNPRRWSAATPTPYIAERAGTIEARMNSVSWHRGTPCS